MDLKFALRSLRRDPGFTLLAIIILALGIGANTAIFSVVDAVILRPLAYRDPDRIVAITSTFKHGGKYNHVSGPDFVDLRNQSSAFESMAAYQADVTSVVTNSSAEFAGMAEVSKDFFKTLGIEPVQGRGFIASDWKGKPADIALVSESFWERHFGNQPFSSGRTLKVMSTSFDIIGILPFGFHFPEESATDVWAPFQEQPDQTSRSSGNYMVIGKLKPGASLQQAQAQLTAIADRLSKAYPSANKDKSALVSPLVSFTVRNVRTILYVLLGAVVLVLLIACANVANLLLARASGRIREFAIRAALGAGQGRLVRQLLVESLLLAGAACLGGVAIAKAALPVLVTLAPKYVPRLDQVRMDASVLLFCIAAAVVASFLFGLAPAFQASRIDPNEGLRVGGARGILGGATGRLRQLFVTAEVALCMVLLVSAGLLLRSFSAMTQVDLGFRPERLLVAEVSVPTSGERANEILFKPLLDRLSSSPRIESAALARTVPGERDSWGSYIIAGQTAKDFTISSPQAGFSIVSPAYFQTMGIPLMGGRSFSDRDDRNAPPVAIISQNLARRSFPKQDPIGQTIFCGLDLVSMKWMKIVGIVRDVRMDSPAQPPEAEIYMPYLQHPRADFSVIVKAGANPLSLAPVVREKVRELNTEASVKLTTMENQLATVVSTPRFSSVLVSVFAGLALVLAIIGIYGVMAYSVSQRTAEMGLRMALGAERADVVQMVLGQALKLTSIGLIAGLAGAAAAARILKSQLFGVSASDPKTYGLMILVLAAVSILASYLPALRASRTEPLDALRQE
ncbi:MAG: ABC transporter permease [Bryobacteraceae bacterium]